jgi:hypothetical protein
MTVLGRQDVGWQGPFLVDITPFELIEGVWQPVTILYGVGPHRQLACHAPTTTWRFL